MKKDLVKLGHCKGPHGVKGAFNFNLINKEASILKKGFKVFLKPLNSNSCIDVNGQEFAIESISFGNKVIVYISGVNNRNQVEEMIPFEIFADRSFFPIVEENEYYLSDLIGCEVYDENNVLLGKVHAISSNGVQDILNIVGNGEEFDILIIENFVKEIDFEQKRLTIIRPTII